MPDGVNIPGGPAFIGLPQPPDVPCDPTGDGWRGPAGPQGAQGNPGIQGPPGTTTVVGGIGEAPADGAVYGRQGSTTGWLAALPLIGGTVSGLTTFNATTSHGAGSTNFIQIAGAANNPTITVAGGGTNGALLLRSQGTGSTNIGSTIGGNIAQFQAASTNGDTLIVTQPATNITPIVFDTIQGAAGAGFRFNHIVNMGLITALGSSFVGPAWLNVGNNVSGNPSTQQTWLVNFGSNSDTATPNSGAGNLAVVNITQKLATGWSGSRTGLQVLVNDVGPTTSSLAKIGASFLAATNWNNGGTSAGFGVSNFGVGSNFGLVVGCGYGSSATWCGGQTGIEVDYHALAGSSYAEGVGIQIVQDGAHAVQATEFDVAMRIANQNSALVGWKNAIFTVGSYPAQWPLDPNGYIFQCQNGHSYSAFPAVGAGGFDLNQFAATGSGIEGGGFYWRSPGVQIVGTGVQVGYGLIANNATGISIDSTYQRMAAAVGSITVAAGGSGFASGDIVADAYGNMFRVVVSGGVVTGVLDMATPVRGYSSSPPANPVAFTARLRLGAGYGSGLTLNLTWTAATGLSLNPTGQRIGFNGTAPIAKPTIAGACAGNTAIKALLTALASYGLVVDTTTA